MELYISSRGFFSFNIVLNVLFFCALLKGMDKEVVQGVYTIFAHRTIKNIQQRILSQLDLRALSRFSSTCTNFQMYSFVKIYPELPLRSVCFRELQDGIRHTKILHRIAKSENIALFGAMWNFHKDVHENELKQLYGLAVSSISLDMAMQAYRNDYEKLLKRERIREKLKKEQEKIDIDYDKLRYALFHGKTGRVRKLLRDVDAVDAFQVIPEYYYPMDSVFMQLPMRYIPRVFFVVCHHQYDVNIVIKLLGKYMIANPDISGHYILKNNYHLISQLAAKQFINIDISDKHKKRALHYAAIKNDRSMVQQLFQGGASVNACDDKNKTPLHYACKGGFLGIVELLLACPNVDISIKDYKGKKPEDLLRKKNKIGVELLKQHVSQEARAKK
jgi:hypothetical protein